MPPPPPPATPSFPPPAPLHLHDLATLLFLHISSSPACASSPPSTAVAPYYDALRTRFLTLDYPSLHHSSPRCVPAPAWTQALYESALLLMRHPTLLPHLSRLPSPPPVSLRAVPSASLALLVLLHSSSPTEQPIRVDGPACAVLRSVARMHADNHALLRHLLQRAALRRVAGTRHAPAHAPRDLVAQPAPPLRARWTPGKWFGYDVDADAAAAALGIAPGGGGALPEQVVESGVERVREKTVQADAAARRVVAQVEKVGGNVEEKVGRYMKARRVVVAKAREQVHRPVVDLFEEGVGGEVKAIANEARQNL